MQPHEQRVVDEARELVDKLVKLGVFINGEVFKSLEATDRRLLFAQQEHMAAYHSALQLRIARFTAQPAP